MIDARKILIESIKQYQPSAEYLVNKLSVGEILDVIIKWINDSLDIKLTGKQIVYLFTNDRVYFGRQEGQTLAYCINLALNDDIVDIRNLEYSMRKNVVSTQGYPPSNRLYYKHLAYYTDMPELKMHYAEGFFKEIFLNVWSRLRKNGFKVREIEGLPLSVLMRS